MSHRTRQAAGFTLIELVVVIVISAIVAVFMVLFLDTPIESYFAQTRRSDLVDSAHRISDAVTVDARTALPNSMRVNAAATALELLATTGVARYYGTGDNPSPGEELTIGSSITVFRHDRPVQHPGAAVLRKIRFRRKPRYRGERYNSATGVMTPAGDLIKVIVNPGTPPSQGENQVTFSPEMTFQAGDAPAVGAQRVPRIRSGELRLQSESRKSDGGNPDALLRLCRHARPGRAAGRYGRAHRSRCLGVHDFNRPRPRGLPVWPARHSQGHSLEQWRDPAGIPRGAHGVQPVSLCAGRRRGCARRQDGFSLVAAIFLIVVLAALGAFAVQIAMTQYQAASVEMLEARTQAAAEAGN